MLTVVTLNWARPGCLLRNLHLYGSYGIVDRVICFNNGPPLCRASDLPRKCVLIEASTDMGLYPRLAVASLARSEAILHTDDDIWVPESTLEALLASWRQAPSSCHGLYGRAVRPDYEPRDVFGPVEVVLTRAVVCSRRVNNAALSATPLFDDIVGVPHGNGEDIILSFAAITLSRSLNVAYRLPSEDYPVPADTAIHRRWPGHLSHRQRVVARCRQVFSL
jgi:Glycosyl transferase family 64 domain